MTQRAISLNLATTRQVWGFAEAVDGCLRAGITALSPWRDQRAAVWLDEAALPNTPAPLALDVDTGPWPRPAAAGVGSGSSFDGMFSANTLHIMGWPSVQRFFAGVDTALAPGGTLVVYGPFNYDGRFSSDSNREFDGWLRARDPASGIRDFEAVDALARDIGLALQADVAMPANNRCLVWRRCSAAA